MRTPSPFEAIDTLYANAKSYFREKYHACEAYEIGPPDSIAVDVGLHQASTDERLANLDLSEYETPIGKLVL